MTAKKNSFAHKTMQGITSHIWKNPRASASVGLSDPLWQHIHPCSIWSTFIKLLKSFIKLFALLFCQFLSAFVLDARTITKICFPISFRTEPCYFARLKSGTNFLWICLFPLKKKFQTIPYQILGSFLFSTKFLLLVKAAGHTEMLNTSPIVHKSFIHGIHKHLRAPTLKADRDNITQIFK